MDHDCIHDLSGRIITNFAPSEHPQVFVSVAEQIVAKLLPLAAALCLWQFALNMFIRITT